MAEAEEEAGFEDAWQPTETRKRARRDEREAPREKNLYLSAERVVDLCVGVLL